MTKNNSSPCVYFDDCGGCNYLHLNQGDYQKLKSQSLIRVLSDVDNVQNPDFHWIEPPNRRKITLHIDQNNKLGFFKKGSRRIIAIDSCYVAVKRISDLILPLQNLIKSIPTKTIQKIQVTSFDNGLDVVFFLNKELKFDSEQKVMEFAKVNKVNASFSFKSNIQAICISSRNLLKLENGLELELGSNSFIQASSQGLRVITKTIRDFIKNNYSKPISLVDFYSGFGVYSFAVSDLTSKIAIFEGSQEMIDVANKNIKNNSITNPFKACHQDLFNFPVPKEDLKKVDLVIINPPRNGALTQIKEIARSNIKSLIYVSCNPKTFVRDFGVLRANGFKITNISAIDQFYSTDHFEIVAIIQK